MYYRDAKVLASYLLGTPNHPARHIAKPSITHIRYLLGIIYIFPNFPNRLNCSSSYTGLLNSLANPDDYHDLNCPCNDFGAPICPANSTQQGELYHYRSVSYDEFYDLAAKNISLWILRTYEELKDLRFISFN